MRGVNALTALTVDHLDGSFGRSSRANSIVGSGVAGDDRVKVTTLTGFRFDCVADTAVGRRSAQIDPERPFTRLQQASAALPGTGHSLPAWRSIYSRPWRTLTRTAKL
jgi:hypothetical protein